LRYIAFDSRLIQTGSFILLYIVNNNFSGVIKWVIHVQQKQIWY
ncbi:hypothetical protein LCGC14_2986370, partial [marine sediment metagenome]